MYITINKLIIIRLSYNYHIFIYRDETSSIGGVVYDVFDDPEMKHIGGKVRECFRIKNIDGDCWVYYDPIVGVQRFYYDLSQIIGSLKQENFGLKQQCHRANELEVTIDNLKKKVNKERGFKNTYNRAYQRNHLQFCNEKKKTEELKKKQSLQTLKINALENEINFTKRKNDPMYEKKGRVRVKKIMNKDEQKQEELIKNYHLFSPSPSELSTDP